MWVAQWTERVRDLTLTGNIISKIYNQWFTKLGSLCLQYDIRDISKNPEFVTINAFH